MAEQSPDLTPYVDLTLYDRDAEDVFETWASDVRSRIPGYVPVETNTEVVVAQSMAYEVAEEIFAINRLPSSTIEGVLRLFGVLRDEGAAPTTTLTFTLGDAAGHSIPAGTRTVLQLPEGQDPVVFTTSAELVVPPGSSEGTVAALGDRLTSDVNGWAVGTLVELLDSVSFAEYVKLGSRPIDGRDPEDTQAWLSRGIARFRRLSGTVTMRAQFEDFALESGIFRARAIDQYDPAQPVTAANGHPGHVSVAVYDRGDLAITPAAKARLLAELLPLTAPHLLVHIIDPSVTAVDVTATLARHSGYTDEVVTANAEAALRRYLHPDNWPWERIVRRTQLITLLAGVEGVAYVQALTTPAADITLPGVAALTRPGAITVAVVLEGT